MSTGPARLLIPFLAMTWKEMPARATLALLLLTLMTLVEGAGVLLLLPLLDLVGISLIHEPAARLQIVVENLFAAIGFTPALAGVLALFVLANLLLALLRRASTVGGAVIEQHVRTVLRDRLMAAVAQARWSFFVGSRGSDVLHALTAETERAASAAAHLIALAVAAATTAVYLGLALQLSAPLTFGVFAASAGVYLFSRRTISAAGMVGSELSAATRDYYAVASDFIAGMRTVRSHGAEQRYLEASSRLTRRIAAAYVDSTRWFAIARFRTDVGSVTILAVMLYVAVRLLGLPAGTLLLLIFAYSRMLPRLMTMQQCWQMAANALPSYGTVQRLTDECSSAGVPEPATLLWQPDALQQEIRLDNVSFAYAGSSRPALHNCSLRIGAAETTVLTGPSGSGKSTVLDMITGLLAPDEGRVLIDGVPLQQVDLRRWRESIGYVPQDVFLFHDSIRANLLWVCPHASDDEIHMALRLAAADDVVANLPRGLDTVVGDRGMRLSGGERQRIALARALLRRPLLLILDEATNALDAANECRIQQALEQLHGRLALLVITHRPAAVRNADSVYFLETGRIQRGGPRPEPFMTNGSSGCGS